MLLDGTDASLTDSLSRLVEPDGSTRVTLETQRVAVLQEPEKTWRHWLCVRCPG